MLLKFRPNPRLFRPGSPADESDPRSPPFRCLPLCSRHPALRASRPRAPAPRALRLAQTGAYTRGQCAHVRELTRRFPRCRLALLARRDSTRSRGPPRRAQPSRWACRVAARARGALSSVGKARPDALRILDVLRHFGGSRVRLCASPTGSPLHALPWPTKRPQPGRSSRRPPLRGTAGRVLPRPTAPRAGALTGRATASRSTTSTTRGSGTCVALASCASSRSACVRYAAPRGRAGRGRAGGATRCAEGVGVEKGRANVSYSEARAPHRATSHAPCYPHGRICTQGRALHAPGHAVVSPSPRLHASSFVLPSSAGRLLPRIG